MRQCELRRTSRQRLMLTPYNTMAFRIFISFVALTATCQLSPCALAEDLVDTATYVKLWSQTLFECGSILIKCDNGNPRNHSLLRNEQNCPSKIMKISNCPLPGDTPTVHILKRLNLTNVRALFFENTKLDAYLERRHFGDLQSLEYLIISFTSFSHMTEDILADLSNLWFLELHANNLRLTEKLFEPLKNLIWLDLQHNNMQTLPLGIFKNQRKLLYLDLWDNQLRNFTKDLIVNATSLAHINLNNNNIETFAPDVFQPLTKLHKLLVDGNYFRELPYGLFANNKNLTEFSLTNNRVALISLPSGLFANLPLLENVRLSCQLENVPEDLFANSTQLANLNMAKNRLATLPEKLLISQDDLNVLNLSHNRLQTLPDTFFRYTQSLRELRLSYNKLEILGEFLAYLPNLKILHIDNNNFSTIHSKAFEDLHSLELLNLANNKIYFLALYKWNEALQKLDLSFNKITSIDAKGLIRFRAIEINLEHNLIHKINFKSMNSIDGSLARGVVRVNLNDNPLQCDCRILHFLQCIRGEYADNFKNNFELVTTNLKCKGPLSLMNKRMDKLSYMELVCPLDDSTSSENRCPRACKCWERPYDEMLLVKCNNGNMERVPTLPYESKFKGIELYVENNTIARLPLGITKGYAHVKRIYAAGNRLHELEDIDLPKGLQYLDVRRNMLQRLNESLLNFLSSRSKLEGLFLSKNAWICNCEAIPLLEFTKNGTILEKLAQKQDFNKIQCAEDAKRPQREQYFKDISVTDICRPVPILPSFIALLGLIVGICLALFYKYNPEIKVFLYAHNCCLWFVTEDELDKDKIYDAFVSYTHKDEAFIVDYLVPELEDGPIPFKLCIHVRDFIIGGCIPDQILRAVEESRRTIIVLSQNFIDSTWGRLEFRAAHQSALNEKRNRLILIIYGDIEKMDNLDKELQLYVKTNTYLKWDDPHFWNKLRYAMPHRNGKENGGAQRTAMNSSSNDGLELGTL